VLVKASLDDRSLSQCTAIFQMSPPVMLLRIHGIYLLAVPGLLNFLLISWPFFPLKWTLHYSYPVYHHLCSAAYNSFSFHLYSLGWKVVKFKINVSTLRKHLSTKLHGVTFQVIGVLTFTAMTTSTSQNCHYCNHLDIIFFDILYWRNLFGVREQNSEPVTVCRSQFRFYTDVSELLG